jgi:DNA-binding transcriptional ArsR family regulator
MTIAQARERPHDGEQDIWRALASPHRRQLLDLLSERPQTTGELAQHAPELSRFAVMQHLGVLEASGLVVVRRRGRYRYNHLNAVPLREWYERWVRPLAGGTAGEVLALKRHVEHESERQGTASMVIGTDEYRVIRIENELRFQAHAERVFEALTTRTLEWFPHTYGGERVRSIVIEPWVGGALYEDWGDGQGRLYGQITAWNAPLGYSSRGQIGPATILDTVYSIEPEGAGSILRVSKVAAGPMSAEEAAGVSTYGDLARFEGALRAVIEG